MVKEIAEIAAISPEDVNQKSWDNVLLAKRVPNRKTSSLYYILYRSPAYALLHYNDSGWHN